jgi:two-component system chemotaxis response regulator CheY
MARILIVDDSRTSRKVLRGILEADGHEVIGEAPDGEQGAKLYSELKPDVVTLDITMPVLDGIGALQKIKEFDDSAKVIMVTAAGQKSKMVEAVKFGATEFVAKPFDQEQLLAIVKKVVAS